MVKPFSLLELEARVSVLVNRRGQNAQKTLVVDDLEFDTNTFIVKRAGKSLEMNPTGLKILRRLMEATPWVVPRQELELKIWGEEMPDSDSLRVHIHGLRAIIDKPFDKPLIHTRHGIGYRIADLDEKS